MRDEMRDPARIVSDILLTVAEKITPGVSPLDLEKIAIRELKKHNVTSYNKGYKPTEKHTPYPAALCVSVNSTFAHGIPDDRELTEGDTVIIDLGIKDKNGNCGDAALTVPVGRVSKRSQLLVEYGIKTTYAAIKLMGPGVSVYQLAKAMERKADERDFVINRLCCSHCIGKEMHEEPLIYNVPNKWNQNTNPVEYARYEERMDIVLKAGWVICIEPIVIDGGDPIGYIDPNNGWDMKTRNGGRASMFEHMVLITDDGCEILTNHFKLPDYCH